MAKTSMVERDKKRKRTAENKKAWMKAWYAEVQSIRQRESQGQQVSFEEKLQVQAKRQKKPRNASLSRWRRRCTLTGRSRGNYRKFGLCRNQLRELGSKGLIPGLRKASW